MYTYIHIYTSCDWYQQTFHSTPELINHRPSQVEFAGCLAQQTTIIQQTNYMLMAMPYQWVNSSNALGSMRFRLRTCWFISSLLSCLPRMSPDASQIHNRSTRNQQPHGCGWTLCIRKRRWWWFDAFIFDWSPPCDPWWPATPSAESILVLLTWFPWLRTSMYPLVSSNMAEKSANWTI